MPFTRTSGGKKLSTEKAFARYPLTAAHRVCHSLQILVGRQSELKLDLVKKVKNVSAEGIPTIARHLDEIVEILFINPWRRRAAAS